jgi:hypothetical protein
MRFWKLPGKLNLRNFFGHSGSCITLPLLPTSFPMIFEKRKFEKTTELLKKDLETL